MTWGFALLLGYVGFQLLAMWREERRFRREQKEADEACLRTMDGMAAEFREDLERWGGRP